MLDSEERLPSADSQIRSPIDGIHHKAHSCCCDRLATDSGRNATREPDQFAGAWAGWAALPERVDLESAHHAIGGRVLQPADAGGPL